MNEKSKWIFWLMGALLTILLSYSAYANATQAKRDDRQYTEIDEIRKSIANVLELVNQNSKQISALAERDKLVNIVQMNADVQTLRGSVTRIERILQN